jgi:hypothetical protein
VVIDERAGRRIGCAVTTAKFIAGVNAQQRQGECVFEAIRLKVPEGATVYVTDPLSEPADHLVEWSTLAPGQGDEAEGLGRWPRTQGAATGAWGRRRA